MSIHHIATTGGAVVTWMGDGHTVDESPRGSWRCDGCGMTQASTIGAAWRHAYRCDTPKGTR